MLIVPRQYQTEAVHSIFDWFEKHAVGNPLIAMPTGTGKSVVIAMFLELVYKLFPSQKILCATHVKELIAQNYQKLIQKWPTAPAGIYSAGLNRRDILQKIIFCGIASVAKRAKDFGHVDLLIIDEAHLVSVVDATMYRAFIRALKVVNPNLRVIGLTATKWRLGHGDITKGDDALFHDTCFDITTLEAFNRLIAEGFLCPLIPKPTRTILDIDGVHMRGGEFIPAELQQAVNKDSVTIAALREALETCDNRKHWLIFASGIEHADHINDLLNQLGVSCGAVHSKMPSSQRDKNLLDFKSGKLRAVVNNNVLTTGFDFPQIDLILCLRPTASAVLWVQMLGRGTRPYEGPDTFGNNYVKQNCLVLDFAGNTRRLGPINDPVIPRKKGEGKGEAPIKLCPSCNTFQHASVRWCTGVHRDGTKCVYEFTFQTKLKQAASTDELIKGDLPIVQRFEIKHITFAKHEKLGAPLAMRVSYYVGQQGLQMFSEFIAPEGNHHYQRKVARDWMRMRMPDKSLEIPDSTLRMIEYAPNFKTPSAIKVWTNKKYPEIMGFVWDENDVSTDVDTGNSRHSDPGAYTGQDISDDDIPF